MQFSIAKLLLVTLFINFIVAASFAFPPIIGFPLVTFICLFVIPPFIIVGAVNTRGIRQAFFLGAMVAGVPHFIVSVYCAVTLAFSVSDNDWSDLSEIESPIRYLHVLGLLIGAMGGISGMVSYYFLFFEPKQQSSEQKPLQGMSMEPIVENPVAAFSESNLNSTASEPKPTDGLETPLPR